ncbi:MAG: helix-turn-helix domain-containing protein [Dehalococcoidia bacterium]|nr:helix-turn-helix domain-containing protein [Dehalococcoidia bacterium]
MITQAKRDYVAEGRRAYEEEAAKKDLWWQMVDARQELGLTQEQMAQRLGVSQAQVARIEKRGYEAHTLSTLRRYVMALGDDFELVVAVRKRVRPEVSEAVAQAG